MNTQVLYPGKVNGYPAQGSIDKGASRISIIGRATLLQKEEVIIGLVQMHVRSISSLLDRMAERPAKLAAHWGACKKQDTRNFLWPSEDLLSRTQEYVQSCLNPSLFMQNEPGGRKEAQALRDIQESLEAIRQLMRLETARRRGDGAAFEKMLNEWKIQPASSSAYGLAACFEFMLEHRNREEMAGKFGHH
jgi:hypothetical protein